MKEIFMRQWRTRSRFATLNVVVLVVGLSVAWSIGLAEGQGNGTLTLRIVDAATGNPTPARVEILDRGGNGYVAEDALTVGGDPVNRKTAWEGTAEEARALLVSKVRNAYTRTDQFYSDGSSRISLSPGQYSLKVIKGNEYVTQFRELEIVAGRQSEKVKMSRWADPAAEAWYSADNHLHIARTHKELDPLLLTWMKAEDIHVATLLEWGNVSVFHNARQYRHGPGGVHQEGNYIVASGQESPRTHMLGHTITLGANEPIHFPKQYHIYRLVWEEAHRQRAISGYAHHGFIAGSTNGLGIDLPLNLLSFLEVMQFDISGYEMWYTVLNSGFRMAPTGASDYPFGRTLPGRERFYTKVEGPLTYESWIEGVRRGRTFVTNGPILDFRVEGRDIGEDVVVPETGRVRVEGRVRFDPARDNVRMLELIEGGRVLRSFLRQGTDSEIQCQLDVEITEVTWLALRVTGTKVGEAREAPTMAHTGAIYVSPENAAPLSEGPRAKALAHVWIARLKEMEYRLKSQVKWMGLSGWDDSISEAYLTENRPALMAEIKRAKEYYIKQAE